MNLLDRIDQAYVVVSFGSPNRVLGTRVLEIVMDGPKVGTRIHADSLRGNLGSILEIHFGKPAAAVDLMKVLNVLEGVSELPDVEIVEVTVRVDGVDQKVSFANLCASVGVWRERLLQSAK